MRTHGIDINADTPLQWLSEHLSYPDNFLHLQLTYFAQTVQPIVEAAVEGIVLPDAPATVSVA